MAQRKGGKEEERERDGFRAKDQKKRKTDRRTGKGKGENRGRHFLLFAFCFSAFLHVTLFLFACTFSETHKRKYLQSNPQFNKTYKHKYREGINTTKKNAH